MSETTLDNQPGEESPASQPHPQVLTGLAMVGGLGMTLTLVAAGLGVIDANADADAIGLAVLVGLVTTLGAILAWFFYVQPHKDFDDITVPMYHGHHHDEPHENDQAHGH